jgi:hypothetical protein
MIVRPPLALLSEPFSRTDLFVVVYCLVDDWMQARFQQSSAPRRRRGPSAAEFSDAEVLTILLMGELCHCPRERAWLRQVRASYRSLFPALPEDSRFSRRAERVRNLLPLLRQAILFWADADLSPFRILDSFPLPLCACYRIRQSSLPLTSATFGRNDRKRLFYYGLRPAILMTCSGYIVDLVLAPGNCNDTRLLANYLDECVEEGRALAGQVWIMDQGYRNQEIVRWAKDKLGLDLLPRQQEHADALPSYWQATLDALRKPVEAMIAVLAGCLGMQRMLVKTEIGAYRRAPAKATAMALGRYMNQIIGGDPMDFARYAV